MSDNQHRISTMSVTIELEDAPQYLLTNRLPPRGGTIELAPGVKWLRLELPFALNHINIWLLRDRLDGRDGWTVVDTCVDRTEARADWEQVFAAELDGLPVLRVLVTHMHPDHVGLAHWLCQRWRTPDDECHLWMSAAEYQAARYACEAASDFISERMADYFRGHGMTNPSALEQIRKRKGYYRSLVPTLPLCYRRMMDSDTIKIGNLTWRCIVGYGHSSEHMALYSQQLNILISGDMILPRISSNVSVYEMEPEADPLGLFLDSINRFLALPEDVLVLPSHGRPFRGLHTRVSQLHGHHRDRLDEVMDVARQRPVCAHDLLPVLFKRTLDLHQTVFALGETVAHLHRLWYGGQLRRWRDADGIWRFEAI